MHGWQYNIWAFIWSKEIVPGLGIVKRRITHEEAEEPIV